MKSTYRRLITRFTAAAVLLTVAGVPGAGCSSAEQRRKDKRERDRQEWRAELTDSLEHIQRRIETNAETLRTLTQDINGMLPSFTHVDNPRHVEGYYILRDFTDMYPLSGTGLTARLTMAEQLEMVAALRGGVFTRIRVTSEGKSLESDEVPYDGALNYRAAGLCTVAFSGSRCDSLGHFITLNDNNPVTLEYLDGSRVTGHVTLSDKTKRMVARTWTLARTRARITALERALPLDNRKLESIRTRLDNDSVQETE
ncbi:MAG: hypothetical protein K2O24_04560 [Muribaculaceae bacterium]|nr:hypothetical protein [Muribaculaceae bacterium]